MPADKHGSAQRVRPPFRLRLAIAIPVLMVLLPLMLGILSYRFLDELLASIPPNSPEYGEIAITLYRVYLASLAISAVALIFGLGISWTISRPIRKMIQTTRQVATGNLSQIAPADTGDEFGDLGNSFNQMVASLNRMIAERNRYILECYTGGLIIVDSEGRITAANRSAENILGRRASELVSRRIDDVLARHRGTEEFREVIKRALRDGAFANSKEVTIKSRSGRALPLLVTTSPLRDVGGQSGVVINFRDVSEIKTFYQKITRADRLAAIGTLAAGVAHEIRNPLGSIKGLAQMLGEQAKPDSDERRYAEVIVREVDRLDGVVRELLEFAQEDRQEARLWNINQILREALEVARWKVGGERVEKISLRENLGNVPALPLNAERIGRAFLNLLINAFEACSASGGEVVVSSALKRNGTDLGTVVVRIENTGETVPPDKMERIFEPFFSTKPKGTGLGLPIAYQIITSHGGTIDVESRGGRTIFTIKFPVTHQALASEKTSGPAPT